MRERFVELPIDALVATKAAAASIGLNRSWDSVPLPNGSPWVECCNESQ